MQEGSQSQKAQERSTSTRPQSDSKTTQELSTTAENKTDDIAAEAQAEGDEKLSANLQAYLAPCPTPGGLSPPPYHYRMRKLSQVRPSYKAVSPLNKMVAQ